jgi:DNA-binding SARP family transcriptional activator/tetratricopeptide (TPR) repeat protein
VQRGANTPLTRALPFRRGAEDNPIVDLSVSVLGPVEVRDGERLLALPRRQHRLLLALLAVRAGELLRTDVLIEELWGGRPPRAARAALHNNVSQLRQKLGAEVIERREVGYLLRLAPEQIDLLRFERLAEEARSAGSAEERAAKLRAALALWRGPAFADLAYEPFAVAEAQRLEELRLAAREDLVDAELDLGRHGDLVPELETLVLEHPFRERLVGQLMLALYRAGRQADALKAYREARAVLLEELGLEPGVQLRELEQAILRQDPALDLRAVLPPVEERRKTVTILLCELEYVPAEIDPERLRRRTVRALAEAQAAIQLHGGSVETRAGDELLGVFGIPAAHEDDALRAVRAAAELRDTVPELRVVIDSGEVLAGHGFVSGDVVSRAKRLQRGAAPGDVLLGETTYALLGDAITAERAAGVLRLLEVDPAGQAVPRKLDAPLVGRKRELAALKAAYEEARAESRCRLATILGEPGIGKTRLVRELVSSLGDEATVLVGRCVSYGEGATWLPLADMLGQAGEGLDTVLETAGSSGEIFLATRQIFERLAAERPLVLVFDDVHWAEPTLLDLAEYLSGRAEGPILCLCVARPELADGRPAFAEGAIRLNALTDRQAEQLAAAVEPELRPEIVAAAGGNPLFLEQLVAYANERGVLESVPPSVEALITARLDLLAPERLGVLQRAAVVGRLFQRADVQELGPGVELLPELEEKGFVRRIRSGFRFHHVLVRDVAYASLPKAERAELHEQLADLLGERGEVDELVGYHLEQAYGFRRELGRVDGRARRLGADAGARLGAAGIAAWKRGDTTATVNLLRRATELLPEHDVFRLELLCELGHALRTGGELARSEETLVRAVETASAVRDRGLNLRAQLELARVRLFSNPDGRADELLDIAAQAIPVFEAIGDHHALGRVWLTLAVVHGPMHCQHGTAAKEVDRAIDHLRRSGWPISACLGLLAAALQNGPTPVPEAIRRCRKLLAGADHAGQANILAPLGALEAMRGRFPEARRLIARSRTLYDQLGQTSTAEANCGTVAGRIELLAGDLAAAERAFRSTCQALEQVGDHAHLATAAAELADVLCADPRFDEAEEWCQLASRLAASDDVLTHILWRATRARLLARKGELDDAEALAREAMRRAEESDGLNRRAKVLLDLSEILRLADKSGEAAEAVEAAVDFFERKRNIVDAKRARALLAELAVA